MCFSPARDLPQQSSSSGDLPPEMMESETPPQVSSPPRMGDIEVLSQRISPGHREVQGTINTAPEGNTSVVEDTGRDPCDDWGWGPGLFGPQPNTALDMDPKSSERPPSREGGAPILATTSMNPEAPNMLRDELQSAYISEEHRTLMGTVAEKIQSAKSGLHEAFTSLLTGFEVCDVMSLATFLMENMPIYG